MWLLTALRTMKVPRSKVLVAGLLACIIGPTTVAQENPARLDSIVALLNPAKSDTHQLSLLIWAAESWTTSNNALPYLARLDTLSAALLQSNDPPIRARARHARGAYHFFTGYHAKFARNIPEALDHFEQAIADFSVDGHLNALGHAHDAIGLVLRLAYGPARAEEHFKEELRIGRKIGRTSLVTQALTHLAALATDNGRLDLADAYLDSCGHSSPGDSALVLVERARILGVRNQFDRQEQALRMAIAIADRSSNEWDKLPALTPLVRSLYERGRYVQGLQVADTCVLLALRMGDQGARCTCLMLMGDGSLAVGDRERAESYWQQGLALAEANHNPGMARELGDEGSMLYAASKLKDLYAEQGRMTEALRMTELWGTLKDSVARMDGREEMLLSDHRRKQLIDSLAHERLLQREILAHAQELQLERTRRYALICTLAVFAVIGLVLWGRYRFMARANQRIIAAQRQVLEAEKQRENEQVRTRIARDIHDEIGAGLTKIALLGNEARRRVQQPSEELNTTLDRIVGHSREVSAALSDIVWSVDPAHDTSQELVLHARNMAQRLLDGSGMAHELRFRHIDPGHPVAPGTKHHVVMVMKEAINNALKYADAKHLTVELEAGGLRVKLSVRDDGKGFDPQAMARTGNGLRNMQARAQAIGAVLTLDGMPGRGSSIRLEGPLS